MSTPAVERRRRREAAGRLAERAASLYLRLKGYRIEGLRVRTPAGEIDILARRGGTLVFVEVKARQSLSLGLESVRSRQQARIAAAAAYIASRRGGAADPGIRFDVIVVRPWRLPRHIADAWRP